MTRCARWRRTRRFTRLRRPDAREQPRAGESLQELQRRPHFEPRVPVAGAPAPPALSPAITRRLSGVVPANMQLDAPWQGIRAARDAVREAHPVYSPSLMIA